MGEYNHTPTRGTLVGRLAAIGILCMLLAACAGSAAQTTRRIEWPPPPAQPQIAWAGEVGSYLDAGIRKGFWRRLADVFVGESDVRIGRPYGIYVDETGRLLIADPAFGVVHVMDAGQNTYTIIGQGEGPAFKNPIAITGDGAGNVYITDSAASLVYRYSFRDNALTPFIHSVERPTGIAFNRRNRLLYVSDTTSSQVVVCDLSGNERFRIGGTGSGPGQFNRPTDLFIDNSGTLYVTDPLNSRIQVFSAEGVFRRAFGRPGDGGGDFSKPKGVAVDSNGTIYVADAQLDAVQVYNMSGGFRFEFGASGSEAGTFWMPSGVHIDRNDRIYVADTYNRRIQIFRIVPPAAPQGKEK
ncbi:6-bladed beta-propeller [Geobacter sp. FeAm09]|uniref:6-bladed beta-propeller n=1 Tax=Geobacter sp. FeAm09 TaxID=2597769 RepID=UPI0011EDE459|nr:6-bladed beta-propeller [Geobacter sp. FeAm09]QEM66776.1 6-bladed beta-propeller [Geobacter sp. FeAm09]QEM70067.1 6-bladed beta-propeller [Geobacter sp. FeAm09]